MGGRCFLARTAVESDVVRRLASQLAARGEANYYREVFISAPLNGGWSKDLSTC